MTRIYDFPAMPTADELKALRETGYYQLDFWRQVPPILWDRLVAGDKFWMIGTIGLARGLATQGDICLHEDLTEEERTALFVLAASGAQVKVHYQNAEGALPPFVALATTASQVVALVETCDKSQSLKYLFKAFSPTQVAQAKQALLVDGARQTGDYYTDSANQAARWFYLTRTEVTADEFAAVSGLAPDALFTIPDDEDPAYATLRTRLAAVLPQARTWALKQLDRASLFANAEIAPFLALWGAGVTRAEDELVTAFAARMDGASDLYKKDRSREPMAKHLARSLSGRSDGHAVLERLRAGPKAKHLHRLYEQAGELLGGLLGLAGKGEVTWATLTPEQGAQVLATSANPRQTVLDALTSADANTALRVYQAIGSFAFDQPDALGDLWALLGTTLDTLDAVLDDSAPTTLPRDGRDTKVSTDDAFDWATRTWIQALRKGNKKRTEDKIVEELRKRHARSKNPRFKSVLSAVVGESFADKLERLIAACTAKDTLMRHFAVRTGEEPGKGDINRLYGSPIGVSAKAWPRSTKGKKRPMQHILTLETSALSEGAQAELGDAAAVAVFLADIQDPGGESALVALSAAALKKSHAPLVEPAIAGARLDVRTLALPKAVVRGGTKTGALKELRVALDRLEDVMITDRTSPRWIQEPEPRGALIAELDESFAPKLTFGDSGAIYVMTGGIVFQCH